MAAEESGYYLRMDQVISRYHEATKHHFARFARSLGYLDWASQPRPFRHYHGSPRIPLGRMPPPDLVTYPQLYDAAVACRRPLSPQRIAEFFRYSLGLSAWKQMGPSRWSLRVNPSSGNLHPTEAYAVIGRSGGLAPLPGVYHYVSETHVLERRCTFESEAWERAIDRPEAPGFLVGLTSIYWREAWKYGERAFRYCQHDAGHALAALRLSAALLGWDLKLMPGWSDGMIAALLGLDRDADFFEAEREAPECLAWVAPAGAQSVVDAEGSLLTPRAVSAGDWAGCANQLSEDHVQWAIIEAVHEAAMKPVVAELHTSVHAHGAQPGHSVRGGAGEPHDVDRLLHLDARRVILQRRSAVDLDGSSSIGLERFARILGRVLPSNQPPWDAIWWPAFIHLALFVQRVDGLEPGLYMLVRREDTLERLRMAMRSSFAWTRPGAVPSDLPFYLLAHGDCRRLAARLCCDQAIAGDGFFSLGMIAEYSAPVARYGGWFYKCLFWEAGFVGQVLYLEAEAHGARGTGIGCYYDDPVHETLGLKGQEFQSLYHFTIGIPIEDTRLTTEPGYEWEQAPPHQSARTETLGTAEGLAPTRRNRNPRAPLNSRASAALGFSRAGARSATYPRSPRAPM